MSVLLLPGSGSLAGAVTRRLLSQEDEVRVIVPPGEDAFWRELGVHVALGEPDDPGLIERAAQNCRTVILLGRHAVSVEIVTAVADGAEAAMVDRLVVCRGTEKGDVPALERWWKGSYVVIDQIVGRWPRAKKVPDELVAEAVDAADDLAGEPRMIVDLNEPEGRALLGL